MERRGGSVCFQCMQLLRQPAVTTSHGGIRRSVTVRQPQTPRSSIVSSYAPIHTQARRKTDVQTAAGRRETIPHRSYAAHSAGQPDLRALHTRVAELSSSALQLEDGKPPSEQRILYVLEQLDAVAYRIINTAGILVTPPVASQSQQTSDTTSATSALLGSVHARQSRTPLSKASLLALISQTATSILHSPPVFLTPAVLKSYVELQSHLSQPSTFPSIFTLYATKPRPSSPTKQQNPNSPSSAIPTATANIALDAAIAAKDLPLAIEIIQTTFATPAHHRSKLLRQALLPGTVLLTSPVLAYAAALRFSDLQTTMSASHATGIAFAGFLTYISTITGLAYVVITTANDQMERVTWARGVPLWERWVREEERRAWDLVAMGWGFRDVERRGEEEGVEWERLREEVGIRGMVLDAVGLMEGME